MWLGTILPLRASTAQRGRQRANSPSLLALGYPSSASDPDTPSSQVLRDSLGREVGGAHFPEPMLLPCSCMFSVNLSLTLSLAMCKIMGNQKKGSLMSKERRGK